MGAAQLIIVNTFFPMSDEERKEFERTHSQQRAMKPSKTGPPKSAQSIPSPRPISEFEVGQGDSRDLEGFRTTGEDMVEVGAVTNDSFRQQDGNGTER